MSLLTGALVDGRRDTEGNPWPRMASDPPGPDLRTSVEGAPSGSCTLRKNPRGAQLRTSAHRLVCRWALVPLSGGGAAERQVLLAVAGWVRS
jgi:hypothetical protein